MVCCIIDNTNQTGISIPLPIALFSFLLFVPSSLTSLLKDSDSRIHYVSVKCTGRGSSDQMQSVQKHTEEEREVRWTEREQMHVCVRGMLDRDVCARVCTLVHVCVGRGADGECRC